jgi:hypothetical protein
MIPKARGKAVQYWGKVWANIVAAGFKGYIAGDFEFQLIIRSLSDCDAGTFGGLFHRLFLFLHALRPEITHTRADGCAYHGTGTGARRAIATAHPADDGTGRSANTSSGGRAFLGFTHVCTTAQSRNGDSNGNNAGVALFHLNFLEDFGVGGDSHPMVLTLYSSTAGMFKLPIVSP